MRCEWYHSIITLSAASSSVSPSRLLLSLHTAEEVMSGDSKRERRGMRCGGACSEWAHCQKLVLVQFPRDTGPFKPKWTCTFKYPSVLWSEAKKRVKHKSGVVYKKLTGNSILNAMKVWSVANKCPNILVYRTFLVRQQRSNLPLHCETSFFS